MKIKFAILISAVIILSASCRNNTESSKYREVRMDDLASGVPAPEKVTVTDDRKIIKEGTISFETSDPLKTRESIVKITNELGGYITRENSGNYSDRNEQTIEIRVPAEKFDQLLSGVTSTAVRIDSKNISAQDVTEEYIDVEARLKTKKELEERYKQLLNKASKVEEMLSIEREMGKLREEIESVEGRFRYLKDRVAFSSLTITFYQKISKPISFGSKFSHGLESGWRNFLAFITGLVTLWPLLILIGGTIFAVLKISRKRSKAKSGQK
jgi:hypothetical protein